MVCVLIIISVITICVLSYLYNNKQQSSSSSPENPKKVDAWGLKTGKKWKFQPDGTINQITICHGREIHSLTFSVKGAVSKKFGGPGGGEDTFDIKKGVRLTGIRGTYGQRESSSPIVITSLIFCTIDGKTHKRKNSQLFGETSGTEFSHDGPIIGFHGYEGDRINAIGIYVRPTP